MLAAAGEKALTTKIMTTLRNMMMGMMLMGSAVMAFPAMSQVMTGHRGASSGQASRVGAPVVERRSSSNNRGVMGGAGAAAGRASGNIERRVSAAQPKSDGGRMFGNADRNVVRNTQASDARRETQANVSHWPSQNTSSPSRYGDNTPSRRNDATNSRRVFGGNNNFDRTSSAGGPVKVENRQYNNASNSARLPGRNLGGVPANNQGGNSFGTPSKGNGSNTGSGIGRRPGSNPGNNGTPGRNNQGGQGMNRGNAPGGGGKTYAQEPPRQERFGGYRNRHDFDRRREAIDRNYRRGFWHGAFVPPPPRPYRPRYISVYAPVRPYGWVPRRGIPLIDGVLGLAFGTVYDTALNYLYGMNYAIDGWANDLVYLRDVPLMRFTWPDVMIRFDDYRRMNYVQMVYSSPYYDRSRLRSLYSDLCVTYGNPVSFRDDALTQVSWYGGDGRGYVTLRYNNVNGRFYTTLSFGC